MIFGPACPLRAPWTASPSWPSYGAASMRYQPVFWRPAPDAKHRHRPFLARLIADSD
jgi:hypothetical protein